MVAGSNPAEGARPAVAPVRYTPPMPRWLAITLLLLLSCAGIVTLGGYAGFSWWKVNRGDGDVGGLPTGTEPGGGTSAGGVATVATGPGAGASGAGACAAGLAAFEAKDYETASTQLDTCVETHPADNASLMLRGRAWAQLERWERADADLEKALAVDPTDERGWEALAYARTHNENDRGAALALDKWIAVNPNAPSAFRMRADVRYRLGDRPGALDDAGRSCALGDADGCTLEGRLKDAGKRR